MKLLVSETDATHKMRLIANDECQNGTPYNYEFPLPEVQDPPVTPDDPCEDAEPLPAVSKYGHRLLVLNLTALAEKYNGFEVEENAVEWFQVVGTAYDNDDTPLGTGYYYTKPNGEPLSGQFYAMVTMPAGFECGLVPTVLLNCTGAAAAPMLVPNAVQSGEVIRLINLDPEQVATINIYSTTGDLVAKYSAANTEEISFKADQTSGYYIVEVQTEVEKVSLRYVVK